MISKVCRQLCRTRIHDQVLRGFKAIEDNKFIDQQHIAAITPLRVLTVGVCPSEVVPAGVRPFVGLSVEQDEARSGVATYSRANYDGIQYIHYSDSAVTQLDSIAIKARCAGGSDWQRPLRASWLSGKFAKSFFSDPDQHRPHIVVTKDTQSLIMTDIFNDIPVVRLISESADRKKEADQQDISNAIFAALMENIIRDTRTSWYWFGATVGAVSSLLVFQWPPLA
jgi:hypothetical protein